MAGGRGPEELARDGPGDAGLVELLGTGAGAVDSADRVDGRPQGRSATTGLAIAGGLVAVIALLWLLGRPSEPEVAQQVVVQPTSTTPVSPTTPVPAVSTTVAVTIEAPVVGELSGLVLFVGGDSALQALDLDSGELSRYGVMAHPVLTTGPDLVLYQDAVGVVGWVPLDDPGQQVMSWKRGPVSLGSGPGLLWVLDPGTDEPHPAGADVGFGRWELFDTADNRRVFQMPGDLYEEFEAFIGQSPPVGGSFDVIRPGPDFSTRPDGVYRVIDSGYIFLAEGRVVAYGLEEVLVGVCRSEGPCDLAWIDVETGEPADLPLPEVRPRVATLVAEGRWLHSVGWDGTSELLELATGRRIEHDWALHRPVLSPDGEWLARWNGSSVLISDLTGLGEPRPVAIVEVFGTDGPDSLLFAASPGSSGLQSPPAS